MYYVPVSLGLFNDFFWPRVNVKLNSEYIKVTQLVKRKFIRSYLVFFIFILENIIVGKWFPFLQHTTISASSVSSKNEKNHQFFLVSTIILHHTLTK